MMRPLRALLAITALLAAATPAGAAERTGRWLVLFEDERPSAAAALPSGIERAGPGEPALGIATVRGPEAALAALRRAPGVAHVVPEYTRDLRRAPNDPAWGGTEATPGVPPGTPLQWALRRQRFDAAWDLVTGAGALVGVLDSGIDAGHPELSGQIESLQSLGAPGDAGRDEDGHGTHVSGLACAATDNGAGVAAAGFGCRVAFYKSFLFTDEDIVRAMVDSADRGAVALNMSFGGGPESPAIERAIDYAYGRGVVLVASASNDPVTDQNSPANQLQPGDAADISRGRGLVVTAADFADRRAGTGRGPQISLAAYGFFDEVEGPPGLVSTYTSLATSREALLCGCRTAIGGDARYAYLQGTSMAAPQVSAAAALVSRVNPALSAADRIRVLKESARRSGGWTPDLGWGILDAGAAVEAARRVDRVAPSSRARARRRARRGGTLRVRMRGEDPRGGEHLIASGIARWEVWLRRGRGRYRLARRVRSDATLTRVRIRRAGSHSLYTRAIDRSGNREAPPARPDVRVRVR